MKYFLFILVFITNYSYSQETKNIRIGLVTIDYTKGFDFYTNDNNFKVNHYYFKGSSANMGLFVNVDSKKIKYGFSVTLPLNNNIKSPYCSLDILNGQYKTDSSFNESFYQVGYSQIYTKYSSSSYVAYGSTNQKDIKFSFLYKFNEYLNVGSGVNIGVRTNYLTINQHNSTTSSLSGYTKYNIYNSYETTVKTVKINNIKIYVPVIIEFNIIDVVYFYVNLNLGSDYNTTIGLKTSIIKLNR
jgi:hypothetical protein